MSFNLLPLDLKLYISEFIVEKPLKLLDWIDEKKLKETHHIKDNIEKLLNSFGKLSIRRIDVFTTSEDHDSYLEERKMLSEQSRDPLYIDYFRNNQDKIDWFSLIENPAIYEVDKVLYKKSLLEYTNSTFP